MLLSTLLNRIRPARTAQFDVGPKCEPQSAQELVEEHYDFIWRLLRRMGLEPADADDAAQQVFVVTLYPEPKPIKPGSERSFLYGVALNVCREFRRKGVTAARHDPGLVDSQVGGRAPDHAAATRQAWERLQHVLAAMSEDIRAVFVLFELEGMTVPEIAGIVDIPLGTVASRLRRGRELFQDQVALLRAALPEENP